MRAFKQTNPVVAISNSFNAARKTAKNYIMKNCYWSERTYYRKIKGHEKLTAAETEVIATAYKFFISEPLTLQLNQLLTA
ncbi:MAG: hypothetical protein JST29_05650 [Bacteroidetes bacterium]|nr:hypothetical protein [Bacteroidota bacterium]